jgi:hypothetical protein
MFRFLRGMGVGHEGMRRELKCVEGVGMSLGGETEVG